MAEKKMSGRALTSLLSTVSFLLLACTGIILYIVPQGRIAYWVNWELLGLSKTQWGNIHVMAALLFIIAGIFHVYFNWKPLMNYLGKKTQGALKHGKELIISVFVLLLIVISGIFSLPPLNYLIEWGDSIKESWIVSKDYEPPFGHAEQVSLRSFCTKMRIPLDGALKALEKAGIKVEGPTQSVGAIASANNISPMAVYIAVRELQPKAPKVSKETKWSGEMVEEKFTGTGLGRKKLGDVFDEIGVSHARALGKLKAKGIQVKADVAFKDAADQAGVSPIDILKIVLVEEGASASAAAPAKKKPAAVEIPAGPWSADKVAKVYEGTGLGNKTLKEALSGTGVKPPEAVDLLKEKGIEAKGSEVMKDIAARADKSPIDLMKIILVK